MRGYALLIGLLLTGAVYGEGRVLPPVVDLTRQAGAPATGSASPGATNQGLYELLGRTDRLEKEVQQLRGMVEEQAHEIETLKKRQKDMYLDMDQRVRQLETGSAPSAEDVQAPAYDDVSSSVYRNPGESVVSETAEKSSAGAGSHSKEAYQNAYSTLQSGRYTDAVGLFKSFLAANPDDRYADNAQYWLGEAYYVTRDFGAARDSFARVIERFPKSPKVPDALLKIAYIDYEQGRWDEARRALSEIIKDYPDSNAASLAEKRLVRMNRERR